MLLRFQPYLMKTVEIWTKKRSKLSKWSKATFKSSYYLHVSWETLYFRRAVQIRHNYNLLSSTTVLWINVIVSELLYCGLMRLKLLSWWPLVNLQMYLIFIRSRLVIVPCRNNLNEEVKHWVSNKSARSRYRDQTNGTMGI